MRRKSLQRLGLSVVAAALLTACSGGGVDISVQGPTISPQPFVPTSEAITTHGTIAGLGSITVNNVTYGTSTVLVTVNGQPGTLSDLQLGQVVTVHGTILSSGLTGRANRIDFDANLVGPVENIDAASHRVTVMGQTVETTPDTLFGTGIAPATVAGLSAGNTVEISGYTDANGAIRATRVDLAGAASELVLLGRVAQHDTANLLFRINQLTLDYSSAIVIDVPGGAPANGMMVKAIGTLSGGLFAVERLVTAPTLGASSGERVQTAGIVTRFNSTGDFDINGNTAAVASAPAYINGAASDLALNAEVVIDGNVAANGRITADRITFGRIVNATTTLDFAFRDFTAITVPTIFKVTVTQGPDFSVSVMVDEDDANRIDVTQNGTTLNIALLSGSGNIETLEAIVTMPALDRIELDGVVSASLHDFNQAQMTVDVGGVSVLTGSGLTIDNLAATVSGVSQLDFGNIRPIGTANIDLSGVSRATLNMDVGATLIGAVSTGQGTGTSMLFYYGTNVTMNVSTGPLSSVVRLGDTRP